MKSYQKAYKSQRSSNVNMLPGDPKGSPDESFYSETLVFIDANFLSKLSNYFGKGKYLIYDLIEFSEGLCEKQRLLCKQIFYYTAPPFQSEKTTEEEKKRKDGYDRFVEKLRKKEVIVREGRCQRLKINGKFEYRQKGVDILMAMDLMGILLKFPKIKKIILIASDSDFVPVIESLKEDGIKTVLHTYYEKKRDTNFSRSNHLIKSVYKYVLLSKEYFDKAPLKK
jgi:uncharacterized LabA/DUF88 family protein